MVRQPGGKMKTKKQELPLLDLAREPFSRRETNWAISYGRSAPCRTDRLYLRYIYGGAATELYRIDLDQGADYDVTATPSLLRLTAAAGGIVEITIAETRVVRFRSRGAKLRLTLAESISEASQWEEVFPNRHQLPSSGAASTGDQGAPAGDAKKGTSGDVETAPRAWRAFIRRVKHHIALLSGEAVITAPWHPRSEGSHRHHRCSPFVLEFNPPEAEIAVEDYESEWEPRTYDTPFDECVTAVEADFSSWHSAGPAVTPEYADAAALASYVTWSAVVPASGNFRNPTMLMSKRWMNNAWNWDNYFNAWASCYRDPEFALSQYHLHIDLQHPLGALGDGINEHTVGWTYTKPPVHGWILSKMLAIHDYPDSELEKLYEPLCRWTEWWFTYRDDDGDGICQYHHGNDSGWDDASAFDVTPPVESPDLSALLIIQMEVLADLAKRLGKSSDADSWRRRSQETLDRLVEHSWRGDRFVAMQSNTHHTIEDGGDSLLTQIPIILGHRLPAEQRTAIAAALSEEGRFLLAHGLATESAKSPHFIAEGYWRGPMWAPATMMVVDGLLDAGERDIALTIAKRFCDDCASGGFAECYNAVTGAPIHDPAYTWAASVFVVMSQLF
jgi:hypothetical protein